LIAEYIVKQLQDKDLLVWFDKQQLLPGQDWEAEFSEVVEQTCVWPKRKREPRKRLKRRPGSPAAAPAGGKKERTGRTDIEIEISNQCARLIANAIIYYNSAILSRLLAKYEASGNAKALALIKKLSPAAWRHVHLNGHYTFRADG
jgi:hypothetical protein